MAAMAPQPPAPVPEHTTIHAQWVQYCIVPTIVAGYYGVGSTAVDFTSVVYLLVFVPCIFPVSFILDRLGLRWATLLGAGLTAVGSWVKVFSAAPDRFAVTFTGQALVAAGQVFQLTSSPRMAAVWFGPEQVATACSIGVFGNQLGISLGFLLIPLAVGTHRLADGGLDAAAVGRDLSRMFYTVAGVTSCAFVVALLFFRSEPPLPPSVAQARQRGGGPGADFGGSLRRLLANSSYRLHLLAYGINVGMYNTLCTVLGQLVVNSFQNEEVFAGRVGLIIVLVGTFGSMAFGYILDKTHKYKETSLAIYVFTLLGWIAFSLSVQSQSHVLVYISATLLGWFMGGYMPVGFEVGAELTYPEPEGTATGLLFIPPSLLGLLFTLLLGQLTAVLGDLWACLALSSFLVVGCGLTAAMRRDYRRLAANRGDSPQDGKPAGTTKL
ncbi:uncharacterized MFS-type transporter C09D4.1-like isoform X3 [Bacillus rossius redtenbacheri]|uniref:uncharacterized MFS-type transporter C09D4.1-like isoform X3 n=1 Tax=Bacillus rossius redtenbacheri TaxID=93214 RepID=UPI002FDC9C01